MASRLTQEEENYVRMSLLLTGISPRAARVLFDSEFAPASLDSSLKKEYNKLRDLQKKRIINQQQWSLLFTRFPNVPDSKTFDVTLMITLLRNLANLSSCNGNFDMLPSPNETTPSSDLARIKCYRNMMAHLDEGKLDNSIFIKAWNDITGAVGRLGGQSMKQECDNLKTKILDQTNQEIMLDIKRSNDEIRELKQSVDSLKTANADLTEEVEKLKDTVPWNIRAQIGEDLVEWKENDKINTEQIDKMTQPKPTLRYMLDNFTDEMKKEVSTLKEELTLMKQKNCECATKVDSYNNKSPRFLVPNGQAPVAFHTHLSANFNVSSNHAVAYDVVKINVGDGYNKFSGIFKAPAAGLYFITNTVMSMPNHGIHVEIVKNGVAIGKNWADHNGYESGTMSIITDLDVNDSVWVRDSDGGTERLEHDYNSFSGFLIYTEY
ncbi:unnamed protein product [Mytilus edulis]|uniref:C1q domain-containing protein n=1 Tax=Mytilus edulis TaxID=6550 RepID=A0A8S3T6I5_MYTED|nr:unnamed protein product [Mytilus edulis]